MQGGQTPQQSSNRPLEKVVSSNREAMEAGSAPPKYACVGAWGVVTHNPAHGRRVRVLQHNQKGQRGVQGRMHTGRFPPSPHTHRHTNVQAQQRVQVAVVPKAQLAARQGAARRCGHHPRGAGRGTLAPGAGRDPGRRQTGRPWRMMARRGAPPGVAAGRRGQGVAAGRRGAARCCHPAGRRHRTRVQGQGQARVQARVQVLAPQSPAVAHRPHQRGCEMGA
jgi:hypothetical protein